jgi:hypothetical protein
LFEDMKMSSLPYRAALMAGSLCLSIACGAAHAQAAAVEFKFPREPGSLQLTNEPCTDAKIIRLYEGDVPEPFLAGVLDLNGRVLGGCWYEADGHVFFTDSEGDLLVPQPLVSAFVPAEDLLPSALTVNPAAPPCAGLPCISRRPRPVGTDQ